MADQRPRNRSIRDDELLAQARAFVSDLDAAIVRVDGGDDGGTRQISGLLRGLVLGNKQKGNNLLGRVVERFDVTAPPFGLMGPPVRKPSGSGSFVTGAMPGDRYGDEVTLEDALARLCIAVTESGESWEYTWSGFIALAADKLGGVHVDEKIPLSVDTMFDFGIGDVRTPVYMLRQFGVGVSRYGHQVFAEVVPGYEAPAGAEHSNHHPQFGGFPAAMEYIEFGGEGPPASPPAPEKVGRNQQCPCGSGVKYKRCHGKHPTA